MKKKKKKKYDNLISFVFQLTLRKILTFIRLLFLILNTSIFIAKKFNENFIGYSCVEIYQMSNLLFIIFRKIY